MTRAPAFAAVVLAGLLGATAATPAAAETVRGKVVRVVDGDTAVFKVGERRRTFHLLGAVTPDGTECFATEAIAELKRLLPRGASVRLSIRGRRAAIRRGATKVNVEMVEGGFARAVPMPGPYGEELRGAERRAAAARAGIWSTRCDLEG